MTRIGVVLSSGGGRGVFAHTGFMSALNQLDIEISASSGCSAGAVVGGVLASGTHVLDWADTIARVRTDQYWTPRSIRQLAWGFGIHRGRGIPGLSNPAAAINFLAENLKVDTFQECVYPFSTIAINLDTVEKEIFQEGPLAVAMMASAAMPGLYDPVNIGAHFFSDGAIFDLAPAEAICCRHDLDVLLLHHVAHHDFTSEGLRDTFQQPWTIIRLLNRLIFRRRPWYATGQPRSIHRCPCGCKAVVVVVEPTLPELAWPLAVGGKEILQAAHSHAIAQLEPILDDLRSQPHSLIE